MPSTPTYPAITLVITNSERLAGRSLSSHVFYAEGGTLGSAGTDDWLLQDSAGQVRPCHAEIRLLDGRFCLLDRSGHTFVNHATLPIGRDRRVALRDGDELSISRYRLKVHIGDRQALQLGAQPLDALINEEPEVLEAEEWPPSPMTTLTPNNEPLGALGEATVSASQDPLAALVTSPGVGSKEREASLTDIPSPARNHVSGDDSQEPRQSAMHLPAIQRNKERHMDENLLNDLEHSVGEQLEERWHDAAATETKHVGVAPLMHGLDGDLPFRDSEEQRDFLEEAGRTLQAAIDGLRLLHQNQDNTRYPLRDRRLQPIEDNPLCLGLDYAATLSTLFSAQRSPVHLSAPAAVRECLSHQKQHQAAIEDAIAQALEAILGAFSPETLLKRFQAYRRSSHSPEDESSWAWEMYRHYYQELNSGRQRGFEKLFWEVFEQAYDRSLRHQQREATPCAV